MMSFMDAVNNMLAGKRMIRPSWSGYYAIILNGQNYMWTVGKDNAQSTNSNIYIASLDDILATDWIVKTN